MALLLLCKGWEKELGGGKMTMSSTTEHGNEKTETEQEQGKNSQPTTANMDDTANPNPNPNPTSVSASPSPPPPPKSTISSPKSILHTLYTFLTYTPPRCRWDPTKPLQFSMALNILFAFAAGFTVANLYYSHPILNILAEDFGVRYERVAQIPTVMQAGYAAGLLFLCPLGDLLPRRPFVVGLVGVTSMMWLGLCLTKNLPVFTALSFLVAITTVTPQLMLPLVGDLAPPHRRAASLSIVVSGLQLGILIARVLSGTIANYTSWRAVYWLALALQTAIFLLLWLFMPDYPSTNPTAKSPTSTITTTTAADLTYPKLLWSIILMLPKHPLLVQACLTALLTSATFTSFWTTLTFLLSSPPYTYPPLAIGLFGLIGLAAMCLGPLYARFVTDRFVPHLSVLAGLACCLAGVCLGTFLGPFTIAGPVLQAFLADFGLQTAQIANRAAVFGIEPKRRNGVNTAFMVWTFCGQLVGTAVGSHVYAEKGWVASGSVSVGFVGAAIGVMCVRGPWERGWVGWRGGWSFRKGGGDRGVAVERDEEVGVVVGGEEVVEEGERMGEEECAGEGAVERSEKSLSGSGEDAIRPAKV
ncbi:MFS general substrate transporter [Byssothecium circinans]|uniref:MFS general substrate transporter n=1 Tax=Byssothecium circinans TaxID=147558 RepID=A0A6A5U6J1_9PLEO|nr:MFS general substrate transporter [Byssothecium circinans]